MPQGKQEVQEGHYQDRMYVSSSKFVIERPSLSINSARQRYLDTSHPTKTKYLPSSPSNVPSVVEEATAPPQSHDNER